MNDTDDHTGTCPDCGHDGPLNLDGEPVILHARDCAHAVERVEHEHACPVCDDEADAAFVTPEGLGAHAYFEHAGATVEELEGR